MSDIKDTQILIVDDSTTIRSVITKYLGTAYTTLHAKNGEEAWQIIQSNDNIALVFADMHMPVMNGMLLLKQMRESDDAHIANLPVIMITGHQDSEAAKQASYKMGATDFIGKPFSEIDIISRAKSYVQLNQKISELEKNVSHDAVTGLYNEIGFNQIAEKAIATAQRHDMELSLLTIKIKDFSGLTDKYDKTIVNQIIANIAKNLQDTLRKEETLGYNDNGSFSLLLPMTKVFKAYVVAIRIQTAISKLAFELSSERLRIKLAIGMTSTDGHDPGVDLGTLFAQTGEALAASLQHPNCKVFRHDELNLNDPFAVKNSDDSALSISHSATEAVLPTKDDNRLKIDRDLYDGYMRDILEGFFDNLPKQHLDQMIEPLEAFLAYAREQVELEKATA